MACSEISKLCSNFVISQAVTFTGGNLIINLPAGTYGNGKKYCLVIAQSIPAAATINAPVYITIGTGADLYPLTTRCCTQVTACAMRSRTKYSTIVVTSAASGTFKLLGKPACTPSNNLSGLNGGGTTAME